MRSLVLAIVAVLAAAAPAGAQPADPFLGLWRVTAIASRPDYAALSVREARTLVGLTIEVARNRVQILAPGERRPTQDVCTTPEFLATQSGRARLLADYRLPTQELTALPASFTELTVTCRGNFVTVLRPAGANALIAEIGSVFFRVERTNVPVAPPTGPVVGTPSFNCAQARRADELAICGDAGLARSDRSLAQSFSKLLAALPEAQREALRREQRDWVANRAKQCNITSETPLTDNNRALLVRCLLDLYTARIADLEARARRVQR